MQHTRVRWLAVLLLSLVSYGCHPYNDTYFTLDRRSAYVDAGIRSPIVEFDDDGYMRAPWQLDSALAAIDAAADTMAHPKSPLVVVVFIHGWHNNAIIDNGNLRDFNSFADALQARLQSNESTSKTRVLPIYLAWRGQNTWRPQWYNTYLPFFAAQYLTFFSRKATSERIGRGELETALARISRKWHGWRSSKTGLQENFLVVVGHSFGGAALLTATLPQLVAEQEVATARVESRRKGIVAFEAQSRATQDSLAPADLLIGVNPAIEASMLDRTVLAEGAPFPRDGAHPQLLVLDADNDGARGFWFRIGQSVGNVFHVRTPHSKAENRAVAKLPGQVAYSLGKVAPVLAGSAHTCSTVPGQTGTLYFVALDDRRCTNTVMVVQTHQKIIDGHNGIWGADDREFLISVLSQQHQRILSALR